MPLAFSSRSHGTVAFGFFNIATDLLLLEDRFCFCSDFCLAVARLAQGASAEGTSEPLAGWGIRDPSRMGNLHGAIAGTDLSGLIGATYRLWPFPQEASAFKQDPGGAGTREQVEGLLQTHALPVDLRPNLTVPTGDTSLGGIDFSAEAFGQLIAYVGGGGMPGWKGGRPAPSVLQMMRELDGIRAPWPGASGSGSRRAR